MHVLASVRHALDGSMLPIALRIGQQVTLTAPMKAQYVEIYFRCYPSQETAGLGTGSSSNDHGSFCSTVTRSSWLMIRLCNAFLPQQHGAARGVRGTALERCCSLSDSILVVKGYPTPREALVASLHTRSLRGRWEGATSAAERRHWEGCASSDCGLSFASPFVACTHFAYDDTNHIPGTAASRQATTSYSNSQNIPTSPGGSVTQQWQPALIQWEARLSEDILIADTPSSQTSLSFSLRARQLVGDDATPGGSALTLGQLPVNFVRA
jgi:hypothetical protein